MKTSHGVLQGYNGVAAVDDQNQIIVAAEAFGQGPENNLLEPLVAQTQENLGLQYTKQAKLTVDAGFHSRDNLNYCKEKISMPTLPMETSARETQDLKNTNDLSPKKN